MRGETCEAALSELADLLELLYTARTSFATIQASARTWMHTKRLREGLLRWAAATSPRSVLPSEPEAQPLVRKHESRVWGCPPSRWRVEVDQLGAAGTVRYIVDGERWWVYHPRTGWQSNVRPDGTATPAQIDVSDLGPLSYQFLDASQLIPGLVLKPVERVSNIRREVLRVRAVPRTEVTTALWLGVDDYELLVDAERGVLLMAKGRIDGQVVALVEVTRIAFDEPIPDERFAPPTGWG